MKSSLVFGRLLCASLLTFSATTALSVAIADPLQTPAQDPAQKQMEAGTPQVQQTPDKSHVDPVQRVLKAGLMSGYPDGKFHPEGHISRAELAHILVKTFKVDVRQPQNFDQANMSDVPSNHWAYQDIQTALKANVMEGYRPGRFYPNQAVTRGEGFAILAQAYGVFNFDEQQVSDTLQKYQDSKELPKWADKAWATALHEGFVNTDENAQRLYPEKPMTRGDMAYALSKYLERTYGEFPKTNQ